MKIENSGFYTPPSRMELRIKHHKTALHLLGGTVMGIVIATLFFLAL